MAKLRDMPIQRKLRLVTMLTSGAVLLLACAAFMVSEVIAFRGAIKRDMSTLADIIGNNCSAALAFDRSDEAQQKLTALASHRQIVAAAIYATDETLFAHYPPKASTKNLPSKPTSDGARFEGNTLVLSQPILRNGGRIGTIYLMSDLSELQARLRWNLVIVLGVLGASILLALALSSRLQRVISKPILALADTARSVSERKDYSVRAEKHSQDELGLLTDSFNEMLTQIQQRDTELLQARDELELRIQERTAELATANEGLQRLASIVEFSDDAIISVALDGKILSWNSGAERIYGYSAEEAIGRQIATPDQPTEVPQILERIKRGEHAEMFETVHVRKDGTKLNVSLTASPIHDATGGVTSAAIIARDVSEARQVSEALRRNEERTRRIIETAHDAFICMDSTGVIVDWNPRAVTVFGWSRQEVLGKPLVEVIIPLQYREGHTRGLKHFLTTGEGPVLNKMIEISALHRDGREFPVELSITAVRWEDSYLFNAFVHDITERKQAEEALRDSERRFRDLFESSPDAIFVEDQEGNVLDANPAACRLQGMERDKLVGKNVIDLIPPEIRGDVARRFPVLTEATGEHLESLTLRGDGQIVPVEITTSRIEYLGKPAVLLHVRDITERKRAEKELEKTTEELKRSNTELEQLAYVASHDLQEPLRMVASYTQLLAKRYKGRLDPDADEFIGYAVDGAIRMQALINDMLSYSRVGTKGKPFEPTDCSAVLSRALSNLKIAIEESGAQITNEPLPTVVGDAGQLTQVFQNLIANAVKFRNETSPRVHVSAQRKEHEWIFSVQDNGIGIAPEDSQRIFLIFQRLHGRGEYPGTGIGLAVCKRIIERHGGRIWVESKPGCGSTFYFTIPDKGEQPL